MPLIQSKSKKALQENIAAEMEANPSQEKRAQNLAIAYSVQRKNRKKKLAQGGEVSAADEKRPMPDDEHADKHMDSRASQKPLHKAGWTDDTWSEQASHSKSIAPDSVDSENWQNEIEDNADRARTPEEMDMLKRHRMAKGGLARQHANESNPSDDISVHEEKHIEEKAQSMLEQLMARRRLAHGGEVSNDIADVSENADEEPNHEDQLSFEALKKENYSESEGLAQLDQPEDSNLHGDDIASDEHDKISKMRARMKSIRK